MKTANHQYEDKLLELAYGELPAHEAAAVESHVHSCARCTEALGQIRAVRSAMGALPAEPAPDDGLESLFAYADQAARRNAEASRGVGAGSLGGWWRRWLAPVSGALALGLVAVVAALTGLLADKAMQAPGNAMVAPTEVAAPNPAGAPARAEERLAKSEYSKKARLEEKVAADKKANEAVALGKDQPMFDEAFGGKADAPADALADDYSNSGRQASVDQLERDVVAMRQDAKQVAPKVAAQEKLADKGAVSAGGSVSEGGSGRALGSLSTADSVAASPPAAAKPAPAAAPVPLVAAKEELKRSAPAATESGAAGESEYGNSLGVSLGAKSAPSGVRQQAASRYREQEQGADQQRFGLGDGRGGDTAEARKRQLGEIEQLLVQARAATSARDSGGAARLLLEVLRRDPQGSARLEALSGLCDAYEALSRPDEAATYCSAVMNEYPSSAAARAIADRSLRMQKGAPSKRSKAKSVDFEANQVEQRATPAAEPAQAK